jgi:hypothetical protein
VATSSRSIPTERLRSREVVTKRDETSRVGAIARVCAYGSLLRSPPAGMTTRRRSPASQTDRRSFHRFPSASSSTVGASIATRPASPARPAGGSTAATRRSADSTARSARCVNSPTARRQTSVSSTVTAQKRPAKLAARMLAPATSVAETARSACSTVAFRRRQRAGSVDAPAAPVSSIAAVGFGSATAHVRSRCR